jgi:hypothetical protein
MAFVSFPKSGRLSRGLLVALSPERAWVRSASGHVEVHPRPAIGALPIKADAPAIGARVRVFGWATGIRTGTVTGISEPHLRFAVKVDDTGAIQRYFFSTIFPI